MTKTPRKKTTKQPTLDGLKDLSLWVQRRVRTFEDELATMKVGIEALKNELEHYKRLRAREEAALVINLKSRLDRIYTLADLKDRTTDG